MAQSGNQPPASVPIQSVTVNQPPASQPAPTLSGQTQMILPNQYVMHQPITNNLASTSMILGLIGLVCTLIGPFIGGLTCLFGWLLGLMGIIFGHIGVSKSNQLGGLGRSNAIAGLVSGYITIVLYLLPIVFLLFLFNDAGWL